MTDQIEDAARRLVELERSCWRRGLNMAHPVVAEELREILREVRRQALEDVDDLIAAYHADGGTLDPVRRRLVARDDDGTPNAYNTLLLLQGEIRTALASSKSSFVDPGPFTEATEASSKP